MSKNEPSSWKVIILSSTILGVLFIGTISCNTSKTLTQKKTTTLEVQSANVVLNQLKAKRLSPTWFYAKAKLNFNDNGTELSANSTIILQKDSLIWLSIRKLGIEAARALITKDSVFILNRLESSYSAQSISFLDKELNLPKTESSFAVLQEILLGNAVILSEQNMNCTIKNDSLYSIDNQANGINCKYEILGNKMQLKNTLLEDNQQERTIKIQVDNYSEIQKNTTFAHHRNLQSQSKILGNVSLDIVFSEVEINVPRTIKFDVPPQYRKEKL